MELLNVNPVFLFILFAMGYVFGLLIRNPSAGKFLIFAFVGVFIYQPVRDAGLLASAAFVLGIVIHHITPAGLLDSLQLYRAMRPQRDGTGHEDTKPDAGSSHNKAESAEETYAKYERYKREKAEQKEGASGPKAKPDNESSAGQDKMRRAQEELKRQQDKLRADQEKLRRDQAAASGAADTRSAEEVLGLRGTFTLAELKKAWRREAARWHPDQLRNKPPHLVKQAEEELKRINGAFDELKKKFAST